MAEQRGEVVAVLLTHRGRVCLLRRSSAVGSDRGQWHCVTGFLPPGGIPVRQAELELREETGLSRDGLESFETGPVLRLPDERGGYWIVHVYRVETAGTELRLNWENDDVSWLEPAEWGARPIVRWLPEIVTAFAEACRNGFAEEGKSEWER
ncbi:NUDIX domain-containing protein [Amycolatopsis circi]|uniref:NUDIX domain-containing protein n=1 Tax=Amycolatopsis circi TaxID=871959 RepID=UPI0013BE9573|nr:NUDIX domain-containing protein [Amycolatopsis circi]